MDKLTKNKIIDLIVYIIIFIVGLYVGFNLMEGYGLKGVIICLSFTLLGWLAGRYWEKEIVWIK